MEHILKFRRPIISSSRRFFSTSTTQTEDFKMGKPEEESKEKDKSSILHLENAAKHCTAEVKKFDFYTFVAG
jgi:hypothetical protein